ncbi:DUF1700 domain-containing protein [Paracholeplasma manati]|jgi:uncharacterized membrane protein|uniref:DUF1700 domain-containing protein n=1 Tax=Paracholeplasma manati TaxID=591373 RepID=A0ABT2Y5H8_9MOLU|nr:DUF1700 domain-containing protein [Paracholeplasma manati]MCV2231983.1 DUF1700 domain-containing protein [Paracholeplasma manati]MDG0888863.1 DUF1700 domain-containing protein [Paracholeplasma manati]MDX9807772.1 DUF1700 domain-containing protein [Acholeplasma sp.]
MTKLEFLQQLKTGLSAYSDQAEILNYYEELIDDAVSNGEVESEFIHKLGSIEQIIRTLKKDANFKLKVKNRENYMLREVISQASKGIALFFTIIGVIVLGSISISFISSGGVSFITYLVFLLTKDVSRVEVLIYYVSSMVLGIGLVMVGVVIITTLIKKTKIWLDKAIVKIDHIIKRRQK